MSRGARRSRSSSGISKWIILIVIGVVLIVFTAVFRVRNIEVTGNDHYSEAQVRSMVMGRPFSSNTLILCLTNRNRKIKDSSFVESINVEMKNPSSVIIHIYEKELAGYAYFNGTYRYFDPDGIVVSIVPRPEESGAHKYYPLVEDLPIKSAKEGEKIDNVPDDVIKVINNLRLHLSGRERIPDRVSYDEKYGIILTYGDFRAAMGTDPDVEEKIRQLYGILEKSEGLKGLLHLENYNNNTDEIIFKKD